MKPIRISINLVFVITAFLCMGLVGALDQNQATVQTVGLPENLQPGQTVQVRLFFTSTAADELQVKAVGIHFDWMQTEPTDQYAGYTLPTPVPIPAGGGSYLFQPITITVPTSTSGGKHTYYIAFDGTQGIATPFSWNSPTSYVTVTGDNDSATPAPTNTSTIAPGQLTSEPNLLLYGSIATVVIIIGLSLAIVLLRRKRTRSEPAAEKEANQETPPANKGSEQDFSI